MLVHAAGDHESQWALHALKPVESWTDRVQTVFADSAYQGLENDIESELNWSLSVVEPEGEKAGFSVDPKRWIIERTFSWLSRRQPPSQLKVRSIIQRFGSTENPAFSPSGSTTLSDQFSSLSTSFSKP